MTLYHLLSLRRLCVCVGGGFKQRWNTAIKINRVHEFSLVPMLFSSKKMNMMLICITSITDTVSYTSISGLVLPSSTTGQSNRKHTQTHTNTEPGGRTWHQQPQTIKGVKVLPFLNCSRVHKMGTKTPALPSPGQKRRDEQKERELRPPPPPLTVTKRPLSDASAGSEGFWAKKAAESTKSTHEPSSKTSTYYVTSLHSFDQWIWVSSSHTSTVFMALINISPMARKKKKTLRNATICGLISEYVKLWMNCTSQGDIWWIGLFSCYVRLVHSMEKERFHLHHTECSFMVIPLQGFAPVSLTISCGLFLFLF